MAHIGYSFKKPSWPKGTEVIIEETDYTSAVIHFNEMLFWNFKPQEDVEEHYIIEKVYERNKNDMLSSTHKTK